MHAKKLTLGLKLGTRAFKIESLRGILIDTLLDARGKDIAETYYTKIGETSYEGIVNLISDKNENFLYIDKDNITFTKSAYPSHIESDEAFREFLTIWNIIQKVINFKEIRRIGIVAEFRFNTSKDNNITLIEKLTRITPPNFPAGFNLHYESRLSSPSYEERKPNINTDDFTNIIYDFYDSEIDTSEPETGMINANIDIQKYYAPPLNTKINDAMENHFYSFKKEIVKFEEHLRILGLKE